MAFCTILECWQGPNCSLHGGDFFTTKEKMMGLQLSYSPPRRTPIHLIQNPSGSGEIGSIVYMGSVILALCCDLGIIDVKDKSVIELGSGCGLAGAVFGLRGQPKSLVLSEVPTVVPLLQRNLTDIYTSQDRPLSGLPECASIWWGDTASQAVKGRTFDVILGADIIYEVERANELLRTLWDLSREDTKIYIASSERYATKYFFEEVCPKRFSAEFVDSTSLALLKGLALGSMSPKPGFLSWYPYQIAILTRLPLSRCRE